MDENNEYFRVLRLLWLLKRDKYVPPISLVDDVLRLKRNVVVTAFYSAVGTKDISNRRNAGPKLVDMQQGRGAVTRRRYVARRRGRELWQGREEENYGE